MTKPRSLKASIKGQGTGKKQTRVSCCARCLWTSAARLLSRMALYCKAWTEWIYIARWCLKLELIFPNCVSKGSHCTRKNVTMDMYFFEKHISTTTCKCCNNLRWCVLLRGCPLSSTNIRRACRQKSSKSPYTYITQSLAKDQYAFPEIWVTSYLGNKIWLIRSVIKPLERIYIVQKLFNHIRQFTEKGYKVQSEL